MHSAYMYVTFVPKGELLLHVIHVHVHDCLETTSNLHEARAMLYVHIQQHHVYLL